MQSLVKTVTVFAGISHRLFSHKPLQSGLGSKLDLQYQTYSYLRTTFVVFMSPILRLFNSFCKFRDISCILSGYVVKEFEIAKNKIYMMSHLENFLR